MFSSWITLFDSPWVTIISLNYFFIANIFFSPYVLFSLWTKCHIEELAHLFLQQNFNLETIFFFVLSLVTVFDLALLRELQNRPWTTKLIVFGVIFSEHLVNCMFSWLSSRPMLVFFFCFDLFVQNILFYIKETDSSIFLEFQKLPSCDRWQVTCDTTLPKLVSGWVLALYNPVLDVIKATNKSTHKHFAVGFDHSPPPLFWKFQNERCVFALLH